VKRTGLAILVKLLIAYTVPTVALFSAFAFLAYDIARRDLEAELGKRLSSIAVTAAGQVRGRYLVEMDPTDLSEEGRRPWKNTQRKLEPLRAATGVARIRIFGPDHTSLFDTDPTVQIGQKYNDLNLDAHELRRVLEPPGQAVSSVLFEGHDQRLYKAGYAPVRAREASDEDPGPIVAGLRVEAPAEYFDRLTVLRTRLVTYGGILMAVVVIVSIVVAARITRPLRRLSGAAERIGRGDLGAPIDAEVKGRDEIGTLAHTLEEMRKALSVRDQRLQMMLAGIAHEVRNPLGGIELFAGILRDELPEGDERRAHVQRIERELTHLKAVVSDFLEFARRPKVDLRPLDLEPMLTEVRDLAAADGAASGVEVALDLTPPARAMADATQLRRAILNLCRNAVQATPPGGRVTLAASPAGEARLRIRVTDTGKGIAPDQVEQIFTPFFTTKEKGTGLGLAFVREIVGDHGGTLEVQSELGKGSTFTVELRAA
jgi:signal transduction histidine kinase